MNGKSAKKVCPCCQALLTIDLETGDVLMHEEAKKTPAVDIVEAARNLKKEGEKREKLFQDSLDAEKNREDLLKKKFDEAMKKAKENPDAPPPLRGIDID